MSTWVLLRGLTRESRHWGGFPEILRGEIGDAQIVAPDLPGNGRLNRLRSPSRIGDMMECCRADLTARGLRPPYHLLALSLGGMAAAAWMRAHPEELRGAVLINSSLRPFSAFHERLRPGSYGALLRLVGADSAGRERIILRLTSRGDRSDVLPAWIAFRRERPVSSANALRQLLAAARYRASPRRPEVPLLVLASDRDALVDPRCSRRIAAQWQARIAVHPSAGHDLPLDDPAWVAREVRAWLEDSGRPA